MTQRIFTEDIFKDNKKEADLIKDYEDSDYEEYLSRIFLKRKRDRRLTTIFIGVYFVLFIISYVIV